MAHVRTFADFLVYEFSTSAGGQQLNKCIEILNDMVWKYNIVTLDRLILCLVSISSGDKMTVDAVCFLLKIDLVLNSDYLLNQ